MTVGAEGAHATVLGIGAFDAFGPMRASARDVEYVGGDNGFTGGHVAVQGKRLLWTFGPDQVDGESHNGDIVDERRLYLPSGGTKEQGLRIYDLAPMLESPVHDPSAPKNLFRGDPVALWETSPYRSKPEPVGARFTTRTTSRSTPTTRSKAWASATSPCSRKAAATPATATPAASSSSTSSTPTRRSCCCAGCTRRIRTPSDPLSPRGAVPRRRPASHARGRRGHAQRLRRRRWPDGGPVSDDLQRATEASEWFVPAETPAPVCSVHVFSSKGDRVYIGAYNAGLQVVDFSDPSKPEQVGEYIAPGATAWGAQIHEGYAYVGDMARGLDVLRFTGDEPDRRRSRARAARKR